VINVVMRQGSEQFLFDTSYFWQTGALTAQPILRPLLGATQTLTGYERARYRDVATVIGGPARRDRLWFLGGYQQLRDDDSQPGADPTSPRQSKQDKVYGKLTWRLAPGWQLVQSLHHEW
jgi:hypothetical protein